MPTTISAPAFQLFDLRADRLAAVKRHAMQLAAVRQLEHFFANLHGQLARGHQDQGLRIPLLLVRIDPLQNRNREGGRLAGAGAGLAQHVDARPGRGESSRLESAWAADTRPSPAAASITSERPRSEKLASEGGSAGAALAGGFATQANGRFSGTLSESRAAARTDFDV